MKMAKLRRKNVALLASVEKSREVWRADQATIRKIRDKHQLMVVPALYGRRGSTEARCTQCTTMPFPCPTWKGLNTLLESRAA